MSRSHLPRTTAQLKLALLGDCGCAQTLGGLARDARRRGLTGAEIDTALAGRSFEARSDAAIAYACAIKSGDGKALAAAHARALRIGLTQREIDAVARTARRILRGKHP
jgi:hypothetical protein